MPGNQRSACAVPSIARAAATAVVRNGEGVRLRPISSSTSAGLGRAEAERRPGFRECRCRSGQARRTASTARGRSRPCSRCRASGGAASRSRLPRQGSSPRSPAASSGRRSAALMRQAPGKPQDVLGDDVELDLAGPALDRIALGAQPVARRLAALASARCPIRARRCRRPPSTSSLRRLLSSVPAYFIIDGDGRMRFARLPHRREALAHRREGERVDVERRDLGAEQRVGRASIAAPERRPARRQGPCR